MALMGRRKPGFAGPEIENRECGAAEESVGPAGCTGSGELPAPAVPPTEGEMLAGYVRQCNQARQLVALGRMRQEEPRLDAVMEEMRAMPGCTDIRVLHGVRDSYLYSDTIMSHFYARLLMLSTERINERTIAEMVRYNCRVYPAATPEAYFLRHPFDLTEAELREAILRMEGMDEYRDIRGTAASNGARYLYSTAYFDEAYGKVMADYAEEDDG